MILGTVQLGMDYGIHNTTGKPARKTAFQMLDYAWEHGVTALDTAGAYGDCEDLIGSYQASSNRKFRICTKTASGTARRLSDELEQSLAVLQCGQIWLYYLHRFDACKDNEVIRELERARAQGKITKIGVSVYEPKELEYIVENLPELVDVVQLPFNLLDHVRWKKDGLLQRAKEKNILLFARSVFLQGLLFQEPDSETARTLSAAEALEELCQIAADSSMSMQQLAVSFVLEQPDIDEILLGCETVEQLGQNIDLAEAAGRNRLSARSRRQLEEISRSADEITIDPRKWKKALK